ncbi:uncharacterized protein P174DRAFT_256105 [Aspergillus novofumigatus IBT 16806]|uniref:Uncharacterized protein n=1 Tax=Aspergillus novofumigatus (strain IBT 16806) TaxID=1392255 RepID=A0A2I1C320_ASPN1|nr:uncharacterized protein P174DRAFT_256105 [Aspergillus novofumigatus IBT 16806]PKX91983.1 hypothetical protein P174DRAFT_256105 [Aspergillus novofumigatus IBT 16806]
MRPSFPGEKRGQVDERSSDRWRSVWAGLVRTIPGSFMARARNGAEVLVSCYRVISGDWICHQSMSQELAGNGGEKGRLFVICSDDFLFLGSLCESIWSHFSPDCLYDEGNDAGANTSCLVGFPELLFCGLVPHLDRHRVQSGPNKYQLTEMDLVRRDHSHGCMI